MTKEEMRQEVFKKMTPEQQKVAKEKAEARAQKKAGKEEKERRAIQEKITTELMNNIYAKRKKLQEISHNLRAIQLGKIQYNDDTLIVLKHLLVVDDYDIYREQYIEVIRTAFLFRTPVFTHPVKTAAENFLDAVMTKTKIVELGLILGLLTEGYISKTLAKLLVSQAKLIKKYHYASFIFNFANEIYSRNGNLEEDGSVTPFTASQEKRVKEIYDLYKPE